MESDFRHLLRAQTRTDHDQLDQMITTLNIAHLCDCRVFLRVHHSCFLLMYARSQKNGPAATILSDMIDGLAADLDIVSGNQNVIELEALPALDPLSIDYMVAGSRLGSKILRKRWSSSKDPIVQRANNYFGQAIDERFWPDTCRSLSAVSSVSARADAIVKDTRLQFQLFATAFAKIVAAEEAFV